MPTAAGAADIIFRTVTVYFFLLAGVRLCGKREIGQLMPFDFVLLLVLSNAVQNAMVGPDSSLGGGLVAAGVLLLLTLVLSFLGRRAPRLRRLLEGSPTTLIAHGAVLHRNLAREHLTFDELAQVLREHEVTDPAQVELATLEVDGNVSVIRREPDEGDVPYHFVKSRKRLRRQRVSA
jgi:uncharacterized membrane protein YcaP (DUF421 family)